MNKEKLKENLMKWKSQAFHLYNQDPNFPDNHVFFNDGNPVGIDGDGTRCMQTVERELRIPCPDYNCMKLRTRGAQPGRNVKQKASDSQSAR